MTVDEELPDEVHMIRAHHEAAAAMLGRLNDEMLILEGINVTAKSVRVRAAIRALVEACEELDKWRWRAKDAFERGEPYKGVLEETE